MSEDGNPKGTWRRVSTRFWKDGWVRNTVPMLPGLGYLLQYLMTCPTTFTVPGLYGLSEGQLADDLGWPLRRGADWPDPERFLPWYDQAQLDCNRWGVRELLAKAYEHGFCVFDTRHQLIYLPKRIEYEPPDSENNIMGWRKHVREHLPDCALKWQALRDMRNRLVTLKRNAPWVMKAFQRYFPETRFAGDLPTWDGSRWVEALGAGGGGRPSPQDAPPDPLPGKIPDELPNNSFRNPRKKIRKAKQPSEVARGTASPQALGDGVGGAEETRDKSQNLEAFSGGGGGGSSETRPPRKRKTTTTTNPLTLPVGDLEQCGGPAIDACGFEVRPVDLAAELLERLQERRRGKGIDTARSRFYATGLDGEALELGVPDRYQLAWCMEHEHLSLLEALNAEHPELALRWAEKPEPPEPRPPESWTLAQCLTWLQTRAELSGGATDEHLEAFWVEARDVPPAALMQAARAFRQDDYWRKSAWAVAHFIQPGVWKTRLPKGVQSRIARGEARR